MFVDTTDPRMTTVEGSPGMIDADVIIGPFGTVGGVVVTAVEVPPLEVPPLEVPPLVAPGFTTAGADPP